jgi:hypothetical protein
LLPASVTNGQLSLDDAVAAISSKTLAIYKLLSMDEDRALIDADLALVLASLTLFLRKSGARRRLTARLMPLG